MPRLTVNLPSSVYRQCLAWELRQQCLPAEREVPLIAESESDPPGRPWRAAAVI
jgi:hypothetical protein